MKLLMNERLQNDQFQWKKLPFSRHAVSGKFSISSGMVKLSEEHSKLILLFSTVQRG